MRRDFEALERRRFEALRLLEAGLNPSEVARRVKVARQSVVRWEARCRGHCKEGLGKAGRAGRKAQLSAAQRERLEALLMHGPETLVYQTPLWTCLRVAHLIKQEFGTRHHGDHVWKILMGAGMESAAADRPGGKTQRASHPHREEKDLAPN